MFAWICFPLTQRTNEGGLCHLEPKFLLVFILSRQTISWDLTNDSKKTIRTSCRKTQQKPLKMVASLNVWMRTLAYKKDNKKALPERAKPFLHAKRRSMIDSDPWRHSLQSGTSAFHGSCRTSTAKLRSRVCPRGESCMGCFFAMLRLYVA